MQRSDRDSLALPAAKTCRVPGLILITIGAILFWGFLVAPNPILIIKAPRLHPDLWLETMVAVSLTAPGRSHPKFHVPKPENNQSRYNQYTILLSI